MELAIAELLAAVVEYAWSLVSTLVGVDLPSTSSCSVSKADWLALFASPAVRLAFKAVMLLEFAAMRPSAAAKSEARA